MRTAKLGEICEFLYGKSLPDAKRIPGEYAVFGANGCVGTHEAALSSSPAIVVGRKGSVGEVNYSEKPCWPIDTTYYIDRSSTSEDLRWLFYALTSLRLPELNKATGVPGLNRNDAYEKSLLVPTREQQQRIAAILDTASAVGAKRDQSLALADELSRATFLEMFGDPRGNPKGTETVALGELIRVSSGVNLTAKDMDPNGSYPVYGGNGVNGFHSKYLFEHPQVVIGRVGVYCGSVHVTRPKSWVTDNALFVREYKQPINQTYLEWALRLANLNEYAGRAAQPLISAGRIYPIEILYPSERDQKQFADCVARQREMSDRLEVDRRHAAELFGALAQRAFRGEL